MFECAHLWQPAPAKTMTLFHDTRLILPILNLIENEMGWMVTMRSEIFVSLRNIFGSSNFDKGWNKFSIACDKPEENVCEAIMSSDSDICSFGIIISDENDIVFVCARSLSNANDHLAFINDSVIDGNCETIENPIKHAVKIDRSYIGPNAHFILFHSHAKHSRTIPYTSTQTHTGTHSRMTIRWNGMEWNNKGFYHSRYQVSNWFWNLFLSLNFLVFTLLGSVSNQFRRHNKLRFHQHNDGYLSRDFEWDVLTAQPKIPTSMKFEWGKNCINS